MTNILFFNITGSTNKGDMAYIIGHITCIKRFLPDAEITLLSIDTKVDKIYEDFGVKVQPYRWYKRDKVRVRSLLYALKGISWDATSRIFCAIVNALWGNCKNLYDQYDFIVEPHADGLNEPYYGFWETLYFAVNLLLAQLIIRKPIIIGPASVGPLISKTNKWLVRLIFNKIAVIAIRENVSQDFLRKDMGIINPHIYIVDDLAFLIRPAYTDKVTALLAQARKRNGCQAQLVGITVNHGMVLWNKPPRYTLLMATIIDYIYEKYNANVLLIPQHDPKFPNRLVLNDSDVCQEIYRHVTDKDSVFIVSNEISPEEWKAILGSCDMAIGCRLHCSIMSTSMCIPTITLSYGRKVNSIIGERMGQSDTLVNIEIDNFEHILLNLQEKVDYVWSNRQVIKNILEDRSKQAEECALTYGNLIQQLIPPRKY